MSSLRGQIPDGSHVPKARRWAGPPMGPHQDEAVGVAGAEIEAVLERFRGSAPRVGPSHFEVQRILDAIHQDPFDTALNVKQLKRRCRIRDNNVSCRFRRTVGVAIKDYLERLRVVAACQLLSVEPLTVFDIALSVGYYHPQTFYNVFRRQLGCTPSDYRGRLRGAVDESASLAIALTRGRASITRKSTSSSDSSGSDKRDVQPNSSLPNRLSVP